MRNTVYYIAASLILTSCNNSDNTNEQAKASSTAEQFIGEWNNISLKVETLSKNNSDSNEVFEVDREHWEGKLKIKPIRTFFRADSTWNSAHYNLKDSLVYDPSGKWWVQGDKLTMLQQLPSSDTTIYSFRLESDTVAFESLVDWDMDGKKDDKYFGNQVKVK